MKKIMIISHCILNTAAKVQQDESGLQEEYALREQFLKLALRQNIQLLQLPCPEFCMYGSRRWGHVKPQFDHPFYRETCRKLFEPILLQMQEYASDPERFEILGIVSVEGSPSCGWELTCGGDWGGEIGDLLDSGKPLPPVKMVKAPGVFMEEISKMLAQNGLSTPVCSLRGAIHLLCENGK